MAYGSVNVPGVSYKEFDELRKSVSDMENTINMAPTVRVGVTYNGTKQSPEWDNYNPDKLQIGGTTGAVNAGTYTADFTPKEGYKWADGTKTPRTVTWTIERALVPFPTQSGTLTYTGEAQEPAWSNYNAEKMTLGGVISGTDAGSYNATFTPGANYKFVDGVGAKTVTWMINKTQGGLTLDKESVDIGLGSTTDTVNATRLGDGAVSAISGDENIATVIVDGTRITIEGVSNGTTTITVKCAEGTNYAAPADKIINVTVQMPSAILGENSPEMIQAVARSGQASNIWNVGDKVPIAIHGKAGDLEISGTYYAFIIGFDHNASIEGNNTIHFQFGKDAGGKDIAFVDNVYNDENNTPAFRMNLSITPSSGGWDGSYMRNTICPAFLAALPEDWQAVITACTKYSDNKGDGKDAASSVNATQDKIWLMAEYEVFGQRNRANSAEQHYQKQYDYYSNGNSKVKYKHNDANNTAACHWWLRSIYGAASANAFFCYTNVNGGTDTVYANRSLAFAPGFMVA